ncbi:hypothetical protein G8V06_09430 [Clostridium botulinum D/C]|uniref:hypothetical protein n=1 Tax=Clostridium botulinum TaxID=1491 RepID=UPI001E2C04A6|nr:hypothetical protein [Clostridium botulinum]MCD3234311.1 hypothetical protein [Clostridium botulinum D/C]MCD3240295.1 hypothetical protein [Clostridium botulinum D/C]MCD3267730.1 hypothetical protein [Clostridium botulinum D/C]MCD3306127.1 hypothetical protein [Clostridium botulinum D/C]MCD3314911.1 hypothetical protein [Clostridium botulinum D/C]
MSEQERKINNHPGPPPKQLKKAVKEIVVKLDLDTKEFNTKLDEIYKKIVGVSNANLIPDKTINFNINISTSESNIDRIAEKLAEKIKTNIIK